MRCCAAILRAPYRGDTFALWGTYFSNLLCLYIDTIGSHTVMMIWCVGAMIGGMAFAVFDGRALVVLLLAVEGAFIIGGQNLLYGIAAHICPAPARATGIGAAVAIGRLGAIVNSYAGSALPLIDASGKALFVFVAATI